MGFRFRDSHSRSLQAWSTPCSLAILLAFLTTGCKSVVDIDVPEQPPALALYGFIHPDSPIRVDVYRTAGIDELATSEELRITDARVAVANQGEENELIYLADKGYASGPFPIPGQTYRIEVSRPGFATIHAESTVPARPSVTVHTRKVEQNDSRVRFEVILSLEDLAGENYYRIGCYAFIPPGERLDNREWHEVWFSSADLALRANPADVGGQPLETEAQSVVGAVYVSDDAFENATKQFVLRMDIFEDDLPLRAELVVTSMGSDYFEYHRDLELQRRNTEDPFAEPVPLFSNVRDGEGVFGSYANTVTQIFFQ